MKILKNSIYIAAFSCLFFSCDGAQIPKPPTPPPTQAAIDTLKAPAQAVEAGFLDVVFFDEFNSLNTIDLSNQGVSGKKWFTDRPWAWGVTPQGDLSIENGVLTINPSTESPNVNILTFSQKGKIGQGFQYGYFEARLAFDPADWEKSTHFGFPAFWGVSKNHLLNANLPISMELDFFEAWVAEGDPFENNFVGTVHELNTQTNVNRANFGSNVKKLDGTDWKSFHTYGCLWKQGLIVWYFDNTEVLRLEYSATAKPNPNHENHPVGTFSYLDKDLGGLAVLLGTGIGYPMKVDWVRVWQ